MSCHNKKARLGQVALRRRLQRHVRRRRRQPKQNCGWWSHHLNRLVSPTNASGTVLTPTRLQRRFCLNELQKAQHRLLSSTTGCQGHNHFMSCLPLLWTYERSVAQRVLPRKRVASTLSAVRVASNSTNVGPVSCLAVNTDFAFNVAVELRVLCCVQGHSSRPAQH